MIGACICMPENELGTINILLYMYFVFLVYQCFPQFYYMNNLIGNEAGHFLKCHRKI